MLEVRSEDREERIGFALALLDSYIMGLISIFLGMMTTLRSFSTESITGFVSGLQSGRADAPYQKTSFPQACTEQAEKLCAGLATERAVEGHVVTPEWYQRQLIALSFARFLVKALEDLIVRLERLGPDAETLIAEKRILLATQLIQRGLEACEKFRANMDDMKGRFDQLATLRKVPDIPWPEPKWEDRIGRVDRVRERLVIALAKASVPLAIQAHSDRLPDYLGYAYSVLARECYVALATEKEELFEKLFPAFFITGLSAADRLRARIRDQEQEALLVYSTEPIADLLEISGYALIYSELNGKKYWNTVKKLWDDYLTGHADSQAFCTFVVGTVEFRSSLFARFSRDLERTAWKQDFERQLRARGLLEDEYLAFGLRDRRPVHESPIIRALINGDHVFDDPQDVFIVIYIMSRPEGKKLKLARRTESFANSLRREQSRHQEEAGHEEPST